MPEERDYEDEDSGGARSFWSGSVAFGLVSLPVSLYTANRTSRVSLRMLDEDGTPLARRYFCSEEEIPLSRDDLVRGYEVERGKFIEVEDDELESLMPEKSREIDLRRFVPLADVDPIYFERAYFLVPSEGAIKAYRLLAHSMESLGRAGIATVIMRGKEYLVAIIAEKGILRAETLRFYDELRSPDDVGLPAVDKVSAADVSAIQKEIDSLATDQLDRAELTDEPSRRLLELIDNKLESDQDVLHAPEVPEPETAEVIDLMQILKQSLQAKASPDAEPAQAQREPKNQREPKKQTPEKNAGKAIRSKSNGSKKKTATAKPEASAKNKPKASAVDIDEDMSKTELYEYAKSLDIAGRSHMSKQELAQAIRHSG